MNYEAQFLINSMLKDEIEKKKKKGKQFESSCQTCN
jgi:hypothetical protein